MAGYQPIQVFNQTTLDRPIDDLQRGLLGTISQLQGLVPLTGAYISSTTNSFGAQVSITFAPLAIVEIRHNLGRPYAGYIVANVKWVSGPTVAPLIVENILDIDVVSTTLYLNNLATSTVTADVWVY